MLTNIFSKRQRQIRGEVADVYVYDTIPHPLRVQIVQITDDAIGEDPYPHTERAEIFAAVHNMLAREYGVFHIASGRSEWDRISNFILTEPDAEKVLDAVELAFRFVNAVGSKKYSGRLARKVTTAEAIEELNARFREHGVGYQYASGEVMRVDSAFVHAEVVKPVLRLLAGKQYMGANQEFLNAHEHYRHNRYEEAMTDCLKALESTLKAVCTKRGWTYAETDTVKRLLDLVFTSELVPSYLQSEFTALRSSLESGVPTVRNKQAGHGQGIAIRQVPQHLAAYVLHLTATSILFLVEAEQALPR